MDIGVGKMSDSAGREAEAGRQYGYSTSPDLSSLPQSSESPPNSTEAVNDHAVATIPSPEHARQESVMKTDGKGSATGATTASTKGHKTSLVVGRKPGRRKRDVVATSTHCASTATVDNTEKHAERKARQPRGAGNASHPKRRSRIHSDPALDPKRTSTLTGTLTTTRTSTAIQAPRQPTTADSAKYPRVPVTSPPAQRSYHEAIPNATPDHLALSGPGQFTLRSGQNYDPIRSSTIETPRQSTMSFSPPQSSPSKSINRASESPSISSLIDPPGASSAHHFPFQQPLKSSTPARLQDYSSVAESHLSPTAQIHGDFQPKGSASTSSTAVHLLAVRPSSLSRSSPPMTLVSMEVDSEQSYVAVKQASMSRKASLGTNSTGYSSVTQSPKPTRLKEKDVAAPLSLGSGILSGSLFGGPPSPTHSEMLAPTVVLHVPLDGEMNKYVNFARMAEEQYGFDALHPRLAVQRERLARVAAAGALLEREGKSMGPQSGISADEMSVDDSEAEGEMSTAEMVDNGGSLEKRMTALPIVKKRKMKEDDYDKADPFVDDSELAWEEQAAASKDGFFVYMGPLVPEGEKAAVERYVFQLNHCLPALLSLLLPFLLWLFHTFSVSHIPL